jgi:hypothetical protein
VTPRTVFYFPSGKFMKNMSNTPNIPTADSTVLDIATEDRARWQRHQLVTRVILFILFFVGTALAMITLAP